MSTITKRARSVLCALATGCFAAAAHATPTVVVTWNQAALAEVRAGKLGPPVVARALAVTHTCMYDAWSAYDTRALPTAAATPRRPSSEATDANKAKAVSFAAYRCLLNLFPAGSGRLQALMAQLGYDANDVSANLATPQGIGNAAATAVIADRRNDGSNQYGDLATGAYADYTGYAPVNAPLPFCLPGTPTTCPLPIVDPLRWQPLVSVSGSVQSFVAPHWDKVTPFALSSAAMFDSRPEVAVGPTMRQGAASYQSDVDQILSISGALTAQQKLVVEYWADGPASELPPGHWSLFAQYVSQRDLNTLDEDVKMFFAMQNAAHDAGIVAWHLKRKYDGVRPITAVRQLKHGQPVFAWGGPGQPNKTIDGGKWSPYNPGSNLTPSFPGYVSGHSTFSAAAATVLRSFTGSDSFGFSTVIQPGFGRVEPGVPAVPTTLSYPTFSAAVSEAGMSRLYAGIHFSDDNTVGQSLGNLTGQRAWEMSKFLFDGGLAAGAGSRAASPWTASISWQHTVPALGNRLLLVGVSTTNGNAASGVSYAGQPLQRLGAQNDPINDNRIELWYRLGPPAGTASVVVNVARIDDLVAGAANFNGVNQTTPFGTFRSARGDGGSACVTLANEPAELVAAVLSANGDARSVTSAGTLKNHWNIISDSLFPGASDVIGVGASGPSVPVGTVCETLASPRRWAMIALPLKPAFER